MPARDHKVIEFVNNGESDKFEGLDGNICEIIEGCWQKQKVDRPLLKDIEKTLFT